MPRLDPDMIRSLARRALQTLLRAGERARMRRALRRMDDHILRDIGLTRAEADRLAESLGNSGFAPPEWDSPPHWKQARTGARDCANPACDA